ncbi:MAG TPA: hypothetical protein VGX23_13615 [Actinocrinis sp.]|nr:hypothetical protein [Actinocrinis sp.]
MDRFVAHCVATAVITAALAAVSTLRAAPSDAVAPGPAGGPSAAAWAPAVSGPPAQAPSTPGAGMPSSIPTLSLPPESVPMIPSAGRPAVAAPADPGVLAGIAAGQVCADTHQVGVTAYARWHGRIVFSVKQYYSPSCQARYSYAYPWLQFREQDPDYAIGLAVFDTTHDELDGAVTAVDGVGGPDFFSAPVVLPRHTCSEATVHLFLPDDESDTFSEQFCI